MPLTTHWLSHTHSEVYLNQGRAHVICCCGAFGLGQCKVLHSLGRPQIHWDILARFYAGRLNESSSFINQGPPLFKLISLNQHVSVCVCVRDDNKFYAGEQPFCQELNCPMLSNLELEQIFNGGNKQFIIGRSDAENITGARVLDITRLLTKIITVIWLLGLYNPCIHTLQLDIGLPHKQTPDSSDWPSHLLYVNAQHRRPLRPPFTPDLRRTLWWSMWMILTPWAALQTAMRVHTSRKLTFVQSGAQWTICWSMSAKPRSWLLTLERKRQRHTHPCLHQWSGGGPGESF